jgi:hypothetical protein
MARIRRLIVRLDADPSRRPASIGHNRGPPLDLSWSGWIWRKAAAAAWKTPPREVALRRLRRAEQLGLTYREFAGVLMDRGAWLGAIVFAPGVLTGVKPEALRARFAALENCRILVCIDACNTAAPDEGAALASVNAYVGDKVSALRFVRCAPCSGLCQAPDLARAVRTFLAQCRIAPAEAFMVGAGARDLAAAEDASLALFKPADAYFAQA